VAGTAYTSLVPRYVSVAPYAGVIRHRMVKTKRLLLRQWTEDDFLPFAEMCRNKDVMAFFPNLQTQSESYEMAKKIQALIEDRGWGFWAVEIPNQHKFIGFVGLHTPKDNMPFSPCVEIGWRLSEQHWGKGYATEAATKSLEYAFKKLNLAEVVSFTTLANIRSMVVMQKIGMRNSGQNFMHPGIEVSHPQCEHVLYKISKTEWQQNAL
jgi:RimJ/RimL family protein N-acetyltransferase